MVQTTIQEMFDHVDKYQRNKLKMDTGDTVARQPDCLKLKGEKAVMDTMSIPNLVIRRPSVVQVNHQPSSIV